MTSLQSLAADIIAVPEPTPLVFRGSAAEYFRIWVVNVLLSIVTLGVYSAWAKVRKKKYFYRNTYLREDAFDYHADPVKILKGRLIAVPVLAAYFGIAYFYPGFELLLLLLLSPAFPWLLVRSRVFNARNTSYRNLRFTFAPHLREAYRVFFLNGLLVLVTLGLAYPILVYRLRAFMIEKSGYGVARFKIEGSAGDFFWIYTRAVGITILAFFVVSVIVGQLLMVAAYDSLPAAVYQYLPTVLVLLVYLGFFAYVNGRTTNYMLSRTAILGHKLRSRLKAHSLLWLYVTNLLAIALTFGLAIPWATIRMARYRLACTELLIRGDLDDFNAAPDQNVAATGEELGDFFDFDFGF